jgi:tyrosine-protein kinase Etk/Wzc
VILHLARRPAIERDEVRLYLADTLSVANAIRGGITTRVVPQTDIVQITYQGNDPPQVRDITNSIAENYKEYSAMSQKENATSKANFILERLQDQQVQLRRAQDSLKAFQTLHQTADVSAEQLALATSIVELEKRKQDVVGERRVYENLIGSLQAADTSDEALRAIVGTGAGEKNETIARLFDRWYGYQEKRQQLMTAGGRTADNPDVRANAQMIAQVKLEIQDASRLYLRALQSRLQSIEGQIEAARTSAQAYPPLTAEQARLLANVRTSEQIYTELQSEYQRARIAEAADVGSVTIVDPATLPGFAISPNRRRAATTAIIFGLLLGLGAAVLLDRLDTSIRSPDEIRERYDLTVLGMIPAIQAHDVNAGPQPVAEKNRLVTHADPRSPVAESYRSLRTNLAFARAHQDLRTMVLTSPGPADGKSTTIANLAITFAQQGQRTLVVDADLRRAVLDKTFDVPRSPGLTDAIIGKVSLADAVHETDIPNLFVLGSGEFPPNPSELLGSEGMRKLIAEARESFDAVLFDTPPLLAVTDAAVLSTRVDGTVLVVRMGKTAREAVRRALLTLRAVHPRILGAVLNDVDFRSGSYYGGYGYYYYAYHYHADTPSNGNGHRGRGMINRLRELTGTGGRRR